MTRRRKVKPKMLKNISKQTSKSIKYVYMVTTTRKEGHVFRYLLKKLPVFRRFQQVDAFIVIEDRRVETMPFGKGFPVLLSFRTEFA